MNEAIIAGLNPPQKQAVECLSGPLLVLAGAGSGKTRVLTNRIANLMAHGTPGNQILAVTFTNKAAKEMQTRIEKLLTECLPDHDTMFAKPAVGTFHSICVRILRAEIEQLQNGYSKNFVIFDTDDQRKLIKLIMKEQQMDEKEIKHRAVLAHISSAKNQLCDAEQYYEKHGVPAYNRFAQAVKILFPIYQRRIMEHNALDFDDLLQKTVQVFEKCPDRLAAYRKRWQHILVDEYQDTNFAQYRLIRLLADEHENLCVVGDDHQSIYSFRGADYRNILEFEKDFPKAKTVKLEQNYRSSGNILNNANALIGKNRTGRPKNLWTENEEGQPLVITEVIDEKDEGRFIADKIKTLQHKDSLNYDNFAILYRMNAQSRAIEESLMRNQIPYQIVGGVRFFDRKEIKDIIGYLRLIFNPKDDVSFLRIVNVPTRKIGAATVDVVKQYSNEYGLSLFEVLQYLPDIAELSAAKKLVLQNFYDLILDLQNDMAKNPISILLDRVVDKTEFYKFLDDGTGEGQSRVENVKELFSVAGRYDGAEDSLAAFLEGVALISDIDQMDNTDRVTLMTVHASKGLEFPIVFLPGWEEGMFPSGMAGLEDNIEEERRLGYVAITRAERQGFITHARQRMLFGKTDYSAPSQFLGELDEDCCKREDTGEQFGRTLRRGKNFSGEAYYASGKPKRPSLSSKDDKPSSPEPQFLSAQPATKKEALFGVKDNDTGYAISDRVRHVDFGEGTIIHIAGDVLSVAFKGHGVKKIVASVAPIEKL